MRKIKGSVWFGKIGIVLINNGYEDKSYIGIGHGINQKEDEEFIVERGMPFPLKSAKLMIE